MCLFGKLFGKDDYRKNARDRYPFKCPRCKRIFEKPGGLLLLSMSGRKVYLDGKDPTKNQESISCPSCGKEISVKMLIDGFYDASEYDVRKAKGLL